MESLKQKTSLWVDNITSNERALYIASSAFSDLDFIEKNSTYMAPFQAHPNKNYKDAEKKSRTPKPNPESIYEGLQTTVNLCRVKSKYDPLDPNTTGRNKNFEEFTRLIAGVPFLTLEWAQTTKIEQKSHNANDLINSFVDGFRGILSGDKDAVRDSVKSLVKAALSYSEKKQEYSGFNQNIFTLGTDGKVYFNLYSSTFEISQSSNKGTITFQSTYSLRQAAYSLSVRTWEEVKESFDKQKKESIDDWLNNMNTNEKEGSTIKAICLE
ncbi:hypothetical protein [Pectobacterium peruviense]|uniref:hypothetical protein n=1 Tax=Pectobacterium peruviense TaxID=2066479 RepID=UPI000DE576C2|nr:hypothetical protein [Pectobacterium peruviense]